MNYDDGENNVKWEDGFMNVGHWAFFLYFVQDGLYYISTRGEREREREREEIAIFYSIKGKSKIMIAK
jgi:hypothetical protein